MICAQRRQDGATGHGREQVAHRAWMRFIGGARGSTDQALQAFLVST
jgi:hypothetical protein